MAPDKSVRGLSIGTIVSARATSSNSGSPTGSTRSMPLIECQLGQGHRRSDISTIRFDAELNPQEFKDYGQS